MDRIDFTMMTFMMLMMMMMMMSRRGRSEILRIIVTIIIDRSIGCRLARDRVDPG